MDSNENKNYIIQDIKNELNKKQTNLQFVDVNSYDFELKLEEIRILKKELNMLTGISNINEIDIEKELAKLNKYNFILEMSNEKRYAITSTLDAYNEYKEYEDLKITIPDNLAEVYEGTVKNFSAIEEIESFKKNIIEHKNNFSNEKEKLKSKLNIIDIESYNKLYQNIKNKNITNMDDILNLERLGVIDKVSDLKKLHKELKIWKITNNALKIFDIKEQKALTNKIKEKILKIENEILEDINNYIKYILLYNELNLDVKLEKNNNLSSNILKVKDYINEKEKTYKKFIEDIEKKEIELRTNNYLVERVIKNIDEKNQEKIDFNEINMDELTSNKLIGLIAKKNILNRIIKIKNSNMNEIIKKK